ncbi:hypothetical protein GGS21DRAFT_435741 [Xylaria nigripes]|nr:hypothetical protein GGS21DRAFT_435741 [Xylaria nigripes]
MNEAFTKDTAGAYLKSLLNKRLRIHATDSRLFVGNFKCTDTDRNIVLSTTYEYRQSSQQTPSETPADTAGHDSEAAREIPARYLGLIVIPGEHIVKIEAEEFTSQGRTRFPWGSRAIYNTA